MICTKRRCNNFFRTDSIEKLRAKRPEFEHVFYDPVQFKEMYKYTFTYAKNRDQKCMDIEVKKKKVIYIIETNIDIKIDGECAMDHVAR